MKSITIALSEEQLQKLEEKASRLGVTLEELLRAEIEDMLNQPEEAFRNALEYVLSKNAELYKRLA